LRNGGTINCKSASYRRIKGGSSVYESFESGWEQQAYLKGIESKTYDHFGGSIDLSEDLLFVGADGTAHVYLRNDDQWSPAQLFHSGFNEADRYDGFGSTGAIGGRILVSGASSNDQDINGIAGEWDGDWLSDSGALLIYDIQVGLTPAEIQLQEEQRVLTSREAILDYRNGFVGLEPQTKTITLRNTGTIDVVDLALAVTGVHPADFQLNLSDFETRLGPGMSAEFEVTFAPSGLASRFAEIHVTHATLPDNPFVVGLTGFGLTAESALQESYVKASASSYLGGFARAMDIDGDRAVVGNPSFDSRDEFNNPTTDSGGVFVFVRENGGWREDARLEIVPPQASSSFGSSVAIDGDRILVGAPGESSDVAGINGGTPNRQLSGSGAAYVFVQIGDEWVQEAYIKASIIDGNDQFGFKVGLSGDTAVVSARREGSASRGVNGDQEDDSAADSGALYVFKNETSGWRESAYLKASNTGAGDFFGSDLAVSGNTIAVGAVREDGASVGVNGDEENDFAPNSGALYVFVEDDGEWTQQAYLKTSRTTDSDSFGGAVSLSGDLLVAGKVQDDSRATGVDGEEGDTSAQNSGAAYVFVREESVWRQDAYLKASNTGAGDFFGSAVQVSGNIVVVAANGEDSNSRGLNGDQLNELAPFSGAAYLFVRSQSGWKQHAYIKASNTGSEKPQGDQFGTTIALSGNRLFVGAPGESSSANEINGDQWDDSWINSGAAYAYDLESLVNATALLHDAAEEAGLTGTQASPDAIPWADGISNLLKYSFNMDLARSDSTVLGPVGTSGLPSGRIVSSGAERTFQFQFLRRKERGLKYTPMISEDLDPSTFLPLVSTTDIEQIDALWERVTMTLPFTEGESQRLFFQVAVELR